MDARTPTIATREWLTFRLGQEHYGIDILSVQEIRKFEEPTHIVGAPDDCLGVIDLRGVAVTIVDLRRRFGIPAGFDTATVTVVLGLGGRTVGAVVDAVSDVVQIAPSAIRPAPAFSSVGPNALCITGLAGLPGDDGQGERMVILLDIGRLMSASPADTSSAANDSFAP